MNLIVAIIASPDGKPIQLVAGKTLPATVQLARNIAHKVAPLYGGATYKILGYGGQK